MKNTKFQTQLKKNKSASTSTETIVDALYEEDEAVEAAPVTTRAATEPRPYIEQNRENREKAPVGRPKGENTIQKTVYIPEYLWPYVQAAVKQNGGNMQKYFNNLIEADIDKNRNSYRAAAELYMSLNNM